MISILSATHPLCACGFLPTGIPYSETCPESVTVGVLSNALKSCQFHSMSNREFRKLEFSKLQKKMRRNDRRRSRSRRRKKLNNRHACPAAPLLRWRAHPMGCNPKLQPHAFSCARPPQSSESLVAQLCGNPAGKPSHPTRVLPRPCTPALPLRTLTL